MTAAPTRFRRPKQERLHLADATRGTLRPPRDGRTLRRLRAARRFAWAILFTPPAMLVQAGLLAAGSPAAARFGRFYWAAIARFLGLTVRIVGSPATVPGRPVIFVANHSSWLDIPAIGSLLPAPFVAKDDVAGWPVVGLIAKLGRTVFVSRSRAGLKSEGSTFETRLAAGENLILFPEGTSSDGARVLPFNSSFFAAAFGDARPLIQPVSIVYDRLSDLPVGHASRAVFAWYGDMSLAPHAWQVAQYRGKRATILLHRPLDPADFPNRKALSHAAWQAVADGAAALRQNRPAQPIGTPTPTPAPTPAFA